MTLPASDGEKRISAVLDDLLAHLPGETVALERLIEPLHERAFGLVMLIFVLPNCLPMPGIPFVSTLTGIPIFLLAAQLILGWHSPHLPRWLAQKRIRRQTLARVWQRLRPAILWLERFVGPRYPALIAWRAEQAMAGMIFVLAVILALPIFGGNLLPAWGILLLALAIIERDGLLAVIGWIMGLTALAWIGALFYYGTQFLAFLWDHAREWYSTMF